MGEVCLPSEHTEVLGRRSEIPCVNEDSAAEFQRPDA